MKQYLLPHECTVMLVDENRNSLGAIDMPAGAVKFSEDGALTFDNLNFSLFRSGMALALVVFYGPSVFVIDVGTANSSEVVLNMNTARVMAGDRLTVNLRIGMIDGLRAGTAAVTSESVFVASRWAELLADRIRYVNPFWQKYKHG